MTKTRRIFYIIIFAVIIGYFLSGVYQVNPSEVALVKTFGKYTSMKGPGINYRAPFPFQSHVIVDIQSIRKEEIGFKTVGDRKYESSEDEALMLTVDENIVSVEAVVTYKVKDPVRFAFAFVNPSNLVKFTTESVLRDRISKRNVDEILTAERETVASEVKEITQKLLDTYDVGVSIINVLLQEVVPPQDVIAAFDDVNNARQDRERYINEAQRYANNLLPTVEGEAKKIVLSAEGYAKEKILLAQGESQRFALVLQEYLKSPEITEARLRYETLQEVLPKANRIILFGTGQNINVLNLDKLLGGDGK